MWSVFASGVFRAGAHHACRPAALLLHSASMNRLCYGDNLTVLRDSHAFLGAGVALIYLASPFNSKRDYNLRFKSPKGQQWAEHPRLPAGASISRKPRRKCPQRRRNCWKGAVLIFARLAVATWLVW